MSELQLTTSSAGIDDPRSLSVASSVCSEGEFAQRNSLDDLSDQELIDVVLEKDLECKHLKLENRMFMDFLRANDPVLLETLEALIRYVGRQAARASAIAGIPHSTQSGISISSRRSARLDSVTSINSVTEGRGPKINLTQKMDMIMRAMEDTQFELEVFLKKSYKIKQNLRSELEEFSLREADIKEAREIFEFSVVTSGYDPLTQRIPAEKFIRYMEEWLKSAQLSIQKLRLRTTSLMQLYRKVLAILVQRQELGENIRPVDFEQLRIENKYFREQIDEKSIHLVDLKKMNGGANLVLSNHKNYLQKQEQDYNKLKRKIAEKQKLIVETEEECKKKKVEVDKVRENFDRFKVLKSTYRVPDVIEYVKLKSQMYDLKKNIKIWQRRKKIQDITLNACLRQMKNITGRSKVDPAWLEDEVVEEIPDEI